MVGFLNLGTWANIPLTNIVNWKTIIVYLIKCIRHVSFFFFKLTRHMVFMPS